MNHTRRPFQPIQNRLVVDQMVNPLELDLSRNEIEAGYAVRDVDRGNYYNRVRVFFEKRGSRFVWTRVDFMFKDFNRVVGTMENDKLTRHADRAEKQLQTRTGGRW